MWKELIDPSTSWKRCAYERNWEPSGRINSFVLSCLIAFSRYLYSIFPCLLVNLQCTCSFITYCPSFANADGHNGYILVSANGGINQQRVAVSLKSFYDTVATETEISCLFRAVF